MSRVFKFAVFNFVIVVASAAMAVGASAPTAATADELRRRVEELERKVAEQQELILKLLAASVKAPAVAAAGTSGLEEQLAAELATPAPATDAVEPPVAPAPVTLAASATGRSYLNLSLDGLFAAGGTSERDVATLQPGGHDPIQRGFTVQNVEMVLDGAVDPYFKGQANVVMSLDQAGETVVELEEVFATTTSLPHSLQIKAGQFFTEFGRLNPQHPHAWDFVDQPLINARLFGGDGLRSTGVQISWLMPVPFFSELLLSMQNPLGETVTSFGNVEGVGLFGRTLGRRDVRQLDDLLLVPRYTASFNPVDNQTVLFGASAALGPNASGDDSRTEIYGVDVFWKWKSPTAQKGFPFVKVQAEGMTRRYEAAADGVLPAAVLDDRGWYGQAVWGIKPRWLAGLRYEKAHGEPGLDLLDVTLEERRRLAANITWLPTEFSKLRLQYNRDTRTLFENADSLWFQLEIILGAHASHKF